jgi:hypothetical protein
MVQRKEQTWVPGSARNGKRKKIMFGTLKHLTKAFRAPAAAKREFIYVTVGTDRYDFDARQRQVAGSLRGERAFVC